MAHIALNNDDPGIRGLFKYRPETAQPLNELVEVLLRGPSTLSRGDRELIAAYVSALNDCRYCTMSHAAYAGAQLPGGIDFVTEVLGDAQSNDLDSKIRALLHLAAAVQQGGLKVTPDLVSAARDAGATDLEIHDTVLIAAAFCMFNRYVDGLGTLAPADSSAYSDRAHRIVQDGYMALLMESQSTP